MVSRGECGKWIGESCAVGGETVAVKRQGRVSDCPGGNCAQPSSRLWPSPEHIAVARLAAIIQSDEGSCDVYFFLGVSIIYSFAVIIAAADSWW